MLRVVCCDNCGSIEHNKVSVKYYHLMSSCDKCGRFEIREFTTHFCSVNCMMDWMDRHNVREKGLPCTACVNGTYETQSCPICNGKGGLL